MQKAEWRQAAVGSQRSEVNALPVPKGVAVDFTVAGAGAAGIARR